MHFEHFPGISECWEGVQNDKREVQAGPVQAQGPVGAAAVKCTLSQELDQPTPRGVQVFIPGILLCHPYTQEYAFIEFQELAP